jgi:hypothetical protein
LGKHSLSLVIISKLTGLDLKAISERAFQLAIWRHAESDGWKCHYQYRSAQKLANGQYRGLGTAGWPDVIAVRGDRLLAIEVKKETGSPTPEQRVWIAALNGVPGITAMIVRPRDANAVMEMLR